MCVDDIYGSYADLRGLNRNLVVGARRAAQDESCLISMLVLHLEYDTETIRDTRRSFVSDTAELIAGLFSK
jgi:hypothetical protein